MKTYTITIDFFKKIDTRSILSILNPLINPCSSNKICIDEQARVLKAYQQTANSDGVNQWITILSDTTNVECTRLNYDFGDNVTDYKIAEMTSLINGACATIAHSLQTVTFKLDENNSVFLNERRVEVIDRDTAEKEINNNDTRINNYNYKDCQVANNNSSIENSKNINKNGKY